MNRLQLLGKEATSSLSSSVQIELARLSSGTRRGVPHTLFAPMHYEPNYAYPLLVWLHGPGDDERQLQRIMPLISMRNYAAVGPRGNAEAPDPCPGYDWNHSPAALTMAEQHEFDAIEAASARSNRSSHIGVADLVDFGEGKIGNPLAPARARDFEEVDDLRHHVGAFFPRREDSPRASEVIVFL